MNANEQTRAWFRSYLFYRRRALRQELGEIERVLGELDAKQLTNDNSQARERCNQRTHISSDYEIKA